MAFDDKVSWMSEKSEVLQKVIVDSSYKLADWLTKGKEVTFEMFMGPGRR